MKLTHTYKFAFKTSLFLSIFLLLIISLTSYLFLEKTSLWSPIAITLSFFIISFVIIQIRVERLLYSRVKNIYNEISLLDINDLDRKSITSDMDSLSKEVQRFAEDKSSEIEMLVMREKYRREFLGNVSHELKTPLFTVQGYILTLLEGAINDKTIRNKYLERANKGVERLIDVVKDLDMISKLESGDLNLNFQTFNIIELIQSVFDLLEIKAKKRNITLVFNKMYDTPLLVHADLNRIEQMLINLLDNSIKYGKMNGQTTVSITNYNPEKFIVKVTDDGEGIKEVNKSRIFERFFRVDQSRSREQGGSGLGLSIVKHIAEAHHQEVFVESEFGKGSTFSFTLEKLK